MQSTYAGAFLVDIGRHGECVQLDKDAWGVIRPIDQAMPALASLFRRSCDRLSPTRCDLAPLRSRGVALTGQEEGDHRGFTSRADLQAAMAA